MIYKVSRRKCRAVQQGYALKKRERISGSSPQSLAAMIAAEDWDQEVVQGDFSSDRLIATTNSIKK